MSFCGKILSILPHGWNLIDHHCKLQSELIGTIENSQKPMLFQQGEMDQLKHDLFSFLLLFSHNISTLL